MRDEISSIEIADFLTTGSNKLNIFIRMKRGLIIAILMTSMLAAKAGHRSNLLMPPLACTQLSALPSPAAAIESNSQVAIITPAFAPFKHIPGAAGTTVAIPVAHAMNGLFILPASDDQHAKNYLTHIYPLLHFW